MRVLVDGHCGRWRVVLWWEAMGNPVRGQGRERGTRAGTGHGREGGVWGHAGGHGSVVSLCAGVTSVALPQKPSDCVVEQPQLAADRRVKGSSWVRSACLYIGARWPVADDGAGAAHQPAAARHRLYAMPAAVRRRHVPGHAPQGDTVRAALFAHHAQARRSVPPPSCLRHSQPYCTRAHLTPRLPCVQALTGVWPIHDAKQSSDFRRVRSAP
jgi:hypothetical protein